MNNAYGPSAWLASLRQSRVRSIAPSINKAKVGSNFCPDCEQARSDPDYHKRTMDLMRLIHCGRCDDKHPAFLFSPTERQSDSSAARQCIGYEGRIYPCKHKEVSWSDGIAIDRLGGLPDSVETKSLGPFVVKGACEHHDHEDRGIPQLDLLLTNGSQQEVRLHYRATVAPQYGPHREGEDGKEAYATQVLELFREDELMFCPHFKTTPSRLRDFDSHFHDGDSRYCHMCQVCPFQISIQVGPKPKIECSSISRPLLKDGPTGENWIQLLDPSTCGFFSDQETKHITWCDDHQCDTTFELIRAASLRWLYANQDLLKTMHADEALDQISKRRIKAARQPRQQLYLQ